MELATQCVRNMVESWKQRRRYGYWKIVMPNEFNNMISVLRGVG